TRHEAIHRGEASDAGVGVPYRLAYWLRLPGGRTLAVQVTGRWYADASGCATLAHGVVRLDRSRPAEPHAAPVSRGRSEFLERLGPEVAAALRAKRSLGLLLFSIEDLDRFNEDLGLDGADGVIDEVLRRARTILRRRDVLARCAGNRFAIALSSCPADQALAAAERLIQIAEATPIATAEGPVIASLHVGAAVAPRHAVDAPRLLRQAEEALSVARRGAGARFVMHDPSAPVPGGRRASDAPRLDVIDALNARRVGFARQPVVDARTRMPVFHEALLRVRGPEGGVTGARELLPGIERSGLASLVDTRMLELVVEHLTENPHEALSINVSPSTIGAPAWLGMLAAHLGARPGVGSRLIVEIAETAMGDWGAMRPRLGTMKALGVGLAIDDFGSGHTSLKHLRDLPIDILKIDGAFVQNLARSGDDRFLVRSLIDLARHLGVKTVTEWVEDEDAARLLVEWGVDYLQGDHCGPPVLVESEGRPEVDVA
ncbi:MAG: diguanylate cyclase/phosphodiesterase (GGDEF & EAL domains) with PAS/PAC sensor(s), partial [uncultured Microvirga sp.]